MWIASCDIFDEKICCFLILAKIFSCKIKTTSSNIKFLLKFYLSNLKIGRYHIKLLSLSSNKNATHSLSRLNNPAL